MTSTQAAAVSLLTIPDVAEMLRKSEAQIRWMIHTGTAPRSALIGGRRMFRLADVEGYIEEAFSAADA